MNAISNHWIPGRGQKFIQHRNYGDVVVELVIDFESEGMHNPYPEAGDCEIIYQGIPSWAFKKNLSNMDEAMTLYRPMPSAEDASTRGSACRNCPLPLDEART